MGILDKLKTISSNRDEQLIQQGKLIIHPKNVTRFVCPCNPKMLWTFVQTNSNRRFKKDMNEIVCECGRIHKRSDKEE